VFPCALVAVSLSWPERCIAIGTAAGFGLNNAVVDPEVLPSHARFKGRVSDEARVRILRIFRAEHLVFEILAGLSLDNPALARLPESLAEYVHGQAFFVRLVCPVGTLVFHKSC